MRSQRYNVSLKIINYFINHLKFILLKIGYTDYSGK